MAATLQLFNRLKICVLDDDTVYLYSHRAGSVPFSQWVQIGEEEKAVRVQLCYHRDLHFSLHRYLERTSSVAMEPYRYAPGQSSGKTVRRRS